MSPRCSEFGLFLCRARALFFCGAAAAAAVRIFPRARAGSLLLWACFLWFFWLARCINDAEIFQLGLLAGCCFGQWLVVIDFAGD